MTSLGSYFARDRFPLARILIFILANGFMGLMMDIRVEHVDVVRERAVAWLPILFSGFMALSCVLSFIFWGKLTRRIMIPLFLASLVVGAMGFYFHNHGNIKKVIASLLNAWTDPNMEHSDAPPQLAPLAFAGLGVIGLLTLPERFSS
jgi:hypothetical protein